ncbi:hypothetical protein HAX54_034563, partial [Datura stramonium]|nr:hypothetical protein [Datura stramonium]
MGATSYGGPLQRDRYHGWRPVVTDRKIYRWIRCDGVLGVVAGPLQRNMTAAADDGN